MFRKSYHLFHFSLAFQRFIIGSTVDIPAIGVGFRNLSRTRKSLEAHISIKERFDKDDYKERMFERARQRRAIVLHEEETETQLDNNALENGSIRGYLEEEDEEDEDEEQEETSVTASDGEEEEEEEDEIEDDKEEKSIDEIGLFFELLQYEQYKKDAVSNRYIPFQHSEDDEEYKVTEEIDPTEQWFQNMEEDARLAKEEEKALYAEEEVTVKLIEFQEEEKLHPVLLHISLTEEEETRPNMLYLRKAIPVLSTKTKLFQRKDSIIWEVVDYLNIEDVSLRNYILVFREVQLFLDWCFISNKEISYKLFEQIKSKALETVHHFEDLMEIVPPSRTFQQLIRTQPNIVLLKEKENLKTGMECVGCLYPALTDFKERFKAGYVEFEFLSIVTRLGSCFTVVSTELAQNGDKSLKSLNNLIKEAVSIVPSLMELIESPLSIQSPTTISLVLLHPSITQQRIEYCKLNVHNWRTFSFYSHADFTLNEDETKFRQFCEMYNITRKLQKDFSVHEGGENKKRKPSVSNALFWKESWMRSENRENSGRFNGILPKQFTSIYDAFEVLNQEGMSWPVFLQGLSILSEQKEIGVYAEVCFYEKLRKSRNTSVPSTVLMNGVVDVMRMMCAERQLVMDDEPQTSSATLFDLTPIIHEDEIFA